MIAQAKNGTGKSVAYILPMLQRIDETYHHPQALCIFPTRELARQVYDVAKKLAIYTKINLCLVLRDTENRRYNIHDHVIIGTAGSLRDSVVRKKIDMTRLKVLVLDEADQMLGVEGFRDDAIRVKREVKNNQVQVILFSATFPIHVREFATMFAPNASFILVKEEELSLQNVIQFYMDCENEEQKFNAVCNIYGLLTVNQSVIFCRTRASADAITSRMTADGHAVICLHGIMTSEERDKVIDDFRNGEAKVLVTTNLMARGIDISQVSLVVNYDLPTDKEGNSDTEAYLHRVGRTGRFGRLGVSINLIDSAKAWEDMTAFEQHFQINMHKIPTDDWEEAEQIFKQYLN